MQRIRRLPRARGAALTALLACTALPLLGGCSSSGGTDIVAAPVDPPARPAPLREPAAGAAAGAWRTAEYAASGGSLDRMRAAEGYAQRTAGRPGGEGVRVAVIDTGVDAAHPDLNLAGNWRFISDEPAGQEHGTHVAGIIAGRRDGAGMHGVAYNASIVAMQATRGGQNAGSGTFDTVDVAYAVASAGGVKKQYADAPLRDASGNPIQERHADGTLRYDLRGNPIWRPRLSNPAARADIVNLSLGGAAEAPHMREAMIDAARNGTIIVAATGNEGLEEPAYPARYAADPAMRGLAVAVGAIDPSRPADDNEPRAAFSNWCGAARESCVVAPGVQVNSTVPDGQYGRLDGTSMAAPHVSGALAVLRAAFAQMSPQAIVQRLLSTATDRGAPGTDPVYGRGEVDLGRAMAPVGTLGIATSASVGGPQAPLAATTLSLGAGFGDGLRDSAALRSAVAFDAQGFPFPADLAARTGRRESPASLEALIGGGTRTMTGRLGDGLFALSLDDTHPALQPDTPGFAAETAASASAPQAWFRTDLGGGVSLAGTANGGLARSFGPGELLPGRSGLRAAETAIAAPFESLMGVSTGGSLGFAPDERTRLAVGGFQGSGPDGDGSSRLARAEVAHRPTDWSELRLGAGELREAEGLFGGSASGAFDAGQAGRSRYVSLAAAARLTDRLSLFGSYTEGFSTVAEGAGGLLRDWSAVRSNAFGVGLAYDGVFDESDRVSLLVGQPFRVREAKATLTVPTDRDAAGNVRTASERVSLAPEGRETAISLGYARMLDGATELSAGLFLRLEPDHDPDAKPDLGGAFLLKRSW